MIKSFKLYEEIKRKAPDSFQIGGTFDAISYTFSASERKLLKADDFVIEGNIATDINKHNVFEIERTIIDEYSIIYELRVLDKNGEILKSRKFKSDIYNKIDYLNAILNMCARLESDSEKESHINYDPYGEEQWEDENPENASELERKQLFRDDYYGRIAKFRQRYAAVLNPKNNG